jgi:hypothetical protein
MNDFDDFIIAQRPHHSARVLLFSFQHGRFFADRVYRRQDFTDFDDVAFFAVEFCDLPGIGRIESKDRFIGFNL